MPINNIVYCVYYYNKSLAKDYIIINEKISVKYGPGKCRFLYILEMGITKRVIFEVFNP